MQSSGFIRAALTLSMVFVTTNAFAQATFLDFAAFGSTNCILGNNVIIEDSNDPGGTLLPTLLVGGNSDVHVRRGAQVGGVRAGGDLVLGKSTGSGDSGLAIRGDVVGNAEIQVYRDSTIDGDIDGGTDIVIGPDCDVTGHVTAGGTLDLDPSTTVGGQTAGGSPASVPSLALPSSTTFSPGTTAVGDGSGGAIIDLAPGDYGVLDVGAASTLTLHSGTYTFASISVGQNSTLELEFTTSGMPVEIDEIALLVTGDATFGNSLDIDVNGETGTSGPADIERKDFSGGLVLESHGSFHLQQSGQWVGLVIAPFGSITFGKSSQIWGAGWGLSTHIKQGSVIDFQLADRFDGEDVRVPRIDFALYSEKKTTVGKDVIVSFTASVGSNGDVKVKSGGQTGSVRTGRKLFTGIAAVIHGNQVGNRRAYIRDGSIVEGSVDGGSDKGRVNLGRNTTISGIVHSGGDVLLGENAQVNCVDATCIFPDSEDTAVHPYIDLMEVLVDGIPAVIVGTDTAPDHIVPRDSELTLPPGTYGLVKLGARATLNLSSGEYFFETLKTGKSSTLNLDLIGGELAIFALRDVKMGTAQTINLTGGDATDIYVEAHRNVKIGRGGDWFGTIYAPYKNVIIGQDVPFLGAAYAGKNVIVKDGSSVDFHLADRLYHIITPTP
ncbi:MAG: hypothetical protein VCC00_04860 [Deltaproteobacteria bacterium]